MGTIYLQNTFPVYISVLMMIRGDGDLELIETASAVIDAVGGTSAASQLTGKSVASISNMRRAGRLASGTFLQFADELEARGKSAPSMLWGISPGRRRSRTSR